MWMTVRPVGSLRRINAIMTPVLADQIVCGQAAVAGHGSQNVRFLATPVIATAFDETRDSRS